MFLGGGASVFFLEFIGGQTTTRPISSVSVIACPLFDGSCNIDSDVAVVVELIGLPC